MAAGALFVHPYELTDYCLLYTIVSICILILYLVILFLIQKRRGRSPKDSFLVLGSWPKAFRIVFTFGVVLHFLLPLILFLLAAAGAAILKAAEGWSFF